MRVDARGAHRLQHDGGGDRVLLEIPRRLVEPVTHVRVRREVEDRVASLERAPEALLVEHVTLHELDALPGARAGDELSPSPRQVVVDDDLDALGAQPIRERAPDEARPAGDERLPHASQSWKPADRASDRNICTVSSEKASRSLPRSSSFAMRSRVIVMM